MNRTQLKRQAKAAIHDMKPSLIWITLVYLLVVLLLQFLSLNVNGDFTAMKAMVANAAQGVYEQILPETTAFGALLVTLLDLMVLILGVGFIITGMTVARRRAPSFGQLLDGFGMILRTLCISVLRYAMIFAYSMAYAIPAVLLMELLGPWGLVLSLPLMAVPLSAAYSYALAVYLMVDYRDLGAMGCLAFSRRIMKGHRWELFVLQLSFIGWELLCAIPFVGLWVRPYVEVSCAMYYDRLMQEAGPALGLTRAEEPEENRE